MKVIYNLFTLNICSVALEIYLLPCSHISKYAWDGGSNVNTRDKVMIFSKPLFAGEGNKFLTLHQAEKGTLMLRKGFGFFV